MQKLWFLRVCILSILFVCTLTSAHPHPAMYIEAKSNEIRIIALHWQVVDLQYLRENFVLENCNYSIFMQDPFKYYNIETDVSIYHNCSLPLKIKNNTLFKDYWGDIPILIQTSGFANSEELTSNSKTQSEESNSENFFSLEQVKLPSNPILLLPMLFLLGGFFAFAGDFFNLVLPITLSSKTSNDLLWLKAGIIHLLSTYVVLFLSLNILTNIIVRFNGFIIVLIGFLMLLENYLKRKNFSPLLFALVPCSAALFVSTLLFKDNLFFFYLTPLIMGAGEILVLKLGASVPFPKKFVKYVPYLIVTLGIFLIIKLWWIPK